MTTEDFIIKWNGKYVDTDNAYGAQCMDLMHQYCVEVLGLSQGDLAASCARDVYMNFTNVQGHDKFDKIDNSPDGVPQEGDIVFWINEPYGHVAVFHDGDANSFKSFDQNYPTGSPCHIQQHTYASVGGWLRFKGSQTLQQAFDQCRIDRDAHWTLLSDIAAILQKPVTRDVLIPEVQKLIGVEDANRQKDKQISEANDKIVFMQSQIKTLQDDHDKLTAEILTQSKTIQDQDTQIKELDQNITELQQTLNQPVRTGWKDLLVKLIDKLP